MAQFLRMAFGFVRITGDETTVYNLFIYQSRFLTNELSASQARHQLLQRAYNVVTSPDSLPLSFQKALRWKIDWLTNCFNYIFQY